jgi:hypothetical protein
MSCFALTPDLILIVQQFSSVLAITVLLLFDCWPLYLLTFLTNTQTVLLNTIMEIFYLQPKNPLCPAL